MEILNAFSSDLGNWLGVEDSGLFNFKPSVRPVPLEVHIQAIFIMVILCYFLKYEGYPGKYYCPRMNSMNKPAYAAICTHSPTKPVLIFVSSRRQTRLTALDLIQFGASDESPRQFLNMAEDSLQMVLSQVTDQNLKHTLQFGVGLHHAGLNDRDRSLVEELFANNRIQVLVCTSTLAWGVNLPAHLVIIKGTEFFDGKAKRYVDFPITDILQMMGRAGRPQFDQHGKAVILVHEPKKSFYKKFLYEPFPVESSLREHLQDHINAEIVSGTICHKEDAVHYLTWTYLFRRLGMHESRHWAGFTRHGEECHGHEPNIYGMAGHRTAISAVALGIGQGMPLQQFVLRMEYGHVNNKKERSVMADSEGMGVMLEGMIAIDPFPHQRVVNPAYYGLEDTESETLNLYLSRLVQNTFQDLEDSGCIKVTENSVESTMLGSIASQYYLSYTTVSMFGSNIDSDTSLEIFLHILSGASEYDELPVRHNEENFNEALSERVPYPVDKHRLEDPHVKANLLFQAHFSQLELPISDYITDLKSVLDQSIRIIQAMIDICANSGWLSSTLTCMHLLQMVMQGLWFGRDSSLLMLPSMNVDLASSLSRRGISDVQQLLGLPKAELQMLLDNFPASRLYQVLFFSFKSSLVTDLCPIIMERSSYLHREVACGCPVGNSKRPIDLQHFPLIEVRLKLQQRDGDSAKSTSLTIKLEKINSRHATSKAFVPRFPKVKEEAWWLVLGNVSTSELYGLKRISFTNRLVTRMDLPLVLNNLQFTLKWYQSDLTILRYDEMNATHEFLLELVSAQSELFQTILRVFEDGDRSTVENSVDENWSKVIREESPERCENERIVDPFSAETPYEGEHFDTVDDPRL
ncbi:hypothetical protein GIB67_000661 [Kingdonia uniflora]|uniref:Helicase C-terminal domain-containing protein n=1 Tax=Kingdonia uniflora TaxID=39325 RepID=A0A7J7ND54_9MAGN|nr:hypothetical protein GIB67_000661 [Kingdonia uniflora]